MNKDNEIASQGCQVVNGVGCHYKPESSWCEPCKAQARLDKANPTQQENETWGQRATRERKYIR